MQSVFEGLVTEKLATRRVPIKDILKSEGKPATTMAAKRSPFATNKKLTETKENSKLL